LSAQAFYTNGENEMTTKKTITERNAASAGNWVANDVVERRGVVTHSLTSLDIMDVRRPSAKKY